MVNPHDIPYEMAVLTLDRERSEAIWEALAEVTVVGHRITFRLRVQHFL